MQTNCFLKFLDMSKSPRLVDHDVFYIYLIFKLFIHLHSLSLEYFTNIIVKYLKDQVYMDKKELDQY